MLLNTALSVLLLKELFLKEALCVKVENKDHVEQVQTHRDAFHLTRKKKSKSLVAKDTHAKRNSYRFKGCYKDDADDRDLPFEFGKLHEQLSNANGARAIDWCEYVCSVFYGYKYMGLQNDNECWCGNDFGKHGSSSDCNDDCKVVGSYGESVNCVYEVEDHGYRDNWYGYENYMMTRYMGCYYENKDDRALPHEKKKADYVDYDNEKNYYNSYHNKNRFIPFDTIGECMEVCHEYPFIGRIKDEKGKDEECWCGEDYDKYGEATECSNGCFRDYSRPGFGEDTMCVFSNGYYKDYSTPSPTSKPTTSAPTSKPTTSSPTSKPTTSSPTSKPTTSAPTRARPTSKPITKAPTKEPTNVPSRQPFVRRTMSPTEKGHEVTNANIKEMVKEYCNYNAVVRDKAIQKYGPIATWDVRRVTSMDFLFSWKDFNEDISQWDVSNVTSMLYMFSNSAFNQDLNRWNVMAVTQMGNMFYKASSFEQYIYWPCLKAKHTDCWLAGSKGVAYTPYYCHVVGGGFESQQDGCI